MELTNFSMAAHAERIEHVYRGVAQHDD